MLKFLQRIFAGVLFLIVFEAVVVFGAEPKVVEIIPANGAEDVDPSLREIRVVFDQAMATGQNFSICGGGEKFPNIRGNPRWKGNRTIVMQVRLEPNHEYSFSINCPSAKGFKSAAGEPAEVYPVSFRTGLGEGEGAVEQQKEKAVEPSEAVKELRRIIDEEYSYRDIHGVDWDKVFAENEESLLAARSPAAFATVTSRLLAEAKDKHMWVDAGDKRFSCYKKLVKPNVNFQKLQDFVPNLEKRSSVVYTGLFADGTGYILIDSWAKNDAEALDHVYAGIWEFSDSPGLIIDVRGNGGGSEPLAQQIAGCFVDKPCVYAKHVYRDVNVKGGFGKVNERVLEPNKHRPRYRGKIAVLMGPVNMSSCEAFLLMMKQVPGCVLMGEKSYGSSGNPKGHDLGNGVTVFAPSWKALRPDGTCFEGEGIEPDIEVKVTEVQLQSSDPVLEAAFKLVRRR